MSQLEDWSQLAQDQLKTIGISQQKKKTKNIYQKKNQKKLMNRQQILNNSLLSVTLFIDNKMINQQFSQNFVVGSKVN